MPPFLPRKRMRSESPDAGPSKPPPKTKVTTKTTPTTVRKPTLFDDIDAGTGAKRTAGKGKALLEKLAATDDDESSLSSLSEDEFEDVPNAKRHKTAESSDEDEGMEFEDVPTIPRPEGPAPTGDLELTLRRDTRISLTNPFGTKKGPSKIERQIRISTHQMHVGSLMYHNAIRNSWLCNKELQAILVKHLTPSILERVEKWRQDSGLVSVTTKDPKGKGKAKVTNGRKAKDWGESAKRLDEGQVNKSSGDPIYGLMKRLVPFWRQRFRITAPGLRKLGYKSLQRLDEEMKSFYNEPHDIERHGELIKDLEDFQDCARKMEGSRDVGAQLFTALLRGLGIEARMVASLQPLGFGWSANEEAFEKEPRKLKRPKQVDEDSSEEEASEQEIPQSKKGKAPAKAKKRKPKSDQHKPRGKGAKDAPIELSESDQDASDDDSVIDITPAKQRILPSKPYDKDLLFPHYWTEVLSPVTHTYTPVDPIVLNLIATNADLVAKFEVRGRAEAAKQVTAYIVGHSSDGTAKDVTTRYLKNRMWPSKTKGNRIGVEKVPIYDRNGKVKRYELYDWFKTVMSGYVRGSKACPRTEVDDHEEATVLKPVKPEKKVVEEGKETLASYKASSEFVLQRHLRREEALLPSAKHVKMFPIKGKGETSTEEKVYLRKDVVSCKSQETWHKEGRAPLPGEKPLKLVPYRAATTNRKRELAEAEHASGEKMLQGLYSWDQTDWIIPPPIENGIIPKNSFGNIDLYVESMLPEGASHIPYRGTVKICKRLGIDYAEAVTGFEFGHRMAVPIITGVVVAEEHFESIMEEWQKDEAERVRKEDEKRQKAAVTMWRKMLMGLRIIKRIREEYGDQSAEIDAINPWSRNDLDKDLEVQRKDMEQRDEDMAGGFFPEGHDEEEPAQSTFFPIARENDEEEEGGGFIVEGHEELSKPSGLQTYPTPQSFQSATNSGAAHVSEEEEESEPEFQLARKRGQPPTTKSAKRSTAKVADSENSELDSSEVEAPPPKKRRRPAANKSTVAPTAKAKTPAKKSPVQKSLASRKSKSKAQVDDNEDEGDESPLSELNSEETPKSVQVSVAKAKTPAQKPPIQKTPASRKNKSKLQVDDSEDEDDESLLSELESEEPAKSKKRLSTAKTKVPAVAKPAPKKRAARKSTGVTSPYFKRANENGDQ